MYAGGFVMFLGAPLALKESLARLSRYGVFLYFLKIVENQASGTDNNYVNDYK
jgi:hypothetical protein